MSTQVFFNRPARSIDLGLLWRDMKETRHHLVLASAWFTDTDTASVFIDSYASRKTVIFNAADMDRGTKRAYELIKSYFNNPVIWDEIGEDSPELLYAGINSDRYGVDPTDYADPDTAIHRFVVLGSGNWQEGVMHHKFILCDKVVWLGSFNFTHHARKNYETLVRIDDRSTVQEFYEEVERLIVEPELFYGDTVINGAFKCQICSRICASNEKGHVFSYDDYGQRLESAICKKCWAMRVEQVRSKFGDQAAQELSFQRQFNREK